jgi:sigma-B regulation protein RsbU (phosphoserine phosphatase)
VESDDTHLRVTPPPLLRRRKAKRLDRLDQLGLLLGVKKDQSYQESLFRLDAGDRLLFYTDGLTDAENSAGCAFGDVALLDFLEESDDLTVDSFTCTLRQKVLRWSEKDSEPHQTDDITFVVLDFGS